MVLIKKINTFANFIQQKSHTSPNLTIKFFAHTNKDFFYKNKMLKLLTVFLSRKYIFYIIFDTVIVFDSVVL